MGCRHAALREHCLLNACHSICILVLWFRWPWCQSWVSNVVWCVDIWGTSAIVLYEDYDLLRMIARHNVEDNPRSPFAHDCMLVHGIPDTFGFATIRCFSDKRLKFAKSGLSHWNSIHNWSYKTWGAFQLTSPIPYRHMLWVQCTPYISRSIYF